MYLPKHQYEIIEQSKLDGIESLVDQAGNLIDDSKEIVLTSGGRIFDKLGIDFKKGDFSKAKELFITNFEEDVDGGLSGNSDEVEEYKSSDSKRAPSFKIGPSREELSKGIMTRAFYKNLSTGKVKEISLNSARYVEKSLRPYEQVCISPWLVKGPAKDQIINGYFYEGILSKNQKFIEQIKSIVPGAEQLIEGPDEYVVDTLPLTRNNIEPIKTGFSIPSPSKSVPVPKDKSTSFKNLKLSNKIKEDLYAEPGEFLVEGTNREYVGYYHLHPSKGPMVGAKHIPTFHSRLVPVDKSNSRYGVNIIESDTPIPTTPVDTPSIPRRSGESYSSTPTAPTAPSSTGGSSTSGGSSGGGSSSGGY